MRPVRRLVVNGAFLAQKVTGQQRYARELLRALEQEYPGRITVARPPRWVGGSKVGTWLWVQSLGLRAGRDTALLSMTSRGPVLARRHVVVVHDLFPLDHPEWYTALYGVVHRAVLRLHLRRSAAIVTVSEPVAAQVRALVPEGTPVIVAPNAPAEVFLRHLPSDATVATVEGFGLVPGEYALAVGSRDPRKNVAVLLSALASLPDDAARPGMLALVGSGDAAVYASAGEVSDARGCAVATGYVSDDDLAALYAHAGAVAFPSLDEGFGLPAVEAVACGAPLVVSDIPVFRWVCGEDATYVAPDDARGWAVALVDAAAGRLARPSVETIHAFQLRFSWIRSAHAVGDALLAEGDEVPAQASTPSASR
ncbi:glycosyltransferase family 4 protein [Demequina subtropica]|uniref:glycosyltransferase family 4 protein n=1 Tax=Demequina subtropica TaxID=1638989 RepID=UPI0009E31E02|nr:glycosyltransferase family 1 protein [Demequina subtropica]